MSFFEHLERLRESPVKTRQRILLVSSVVLTLFIAVVWLSSFRLEPLRGAARLEGVEGERNPTSVLETNQLGGFVGSMKDAVSDIVYGFGVVRDRVKSEFEKL